MLRQGRGKGDTDNASKLQTLAKRQQHYLEFLSPSVPTGSLWICCPTMYKSRCGCSDMIRAISTQFLWPVHYLEESYVARLSGWLHFRPIRQHPMTSVVRF